MISYSVTPRINPQNVEADPKYGATAQYIRNLDINEFSRHISSHGCVYSRADIAAVLTLAVDCIREQLLAGNKVTLGDLGSFSVTLSGDHAKDASSYTPAMIKRVNVKWKPGNLMKNLIDEATFTKVSTRIAQRSILNAETNNNGSVNLQAIKEAEKETRK